MKKEKTIATETRNAHTEIHPQGETKNKPNGTQITFHSVRVYKESETKKDLRWPFTAINKCSSRTFAGQQKQVNRATQILF